jgi:hypothetical protein
VKSKEVNLAIATQIEVNGRAELVSASSSQIPDPD